MTKANVACTPHHCQCYYPRAVARLWPWLTQEWRISLPSEIQITLFFLSLLPATFLLKFHEFPYLVHPPSLSSTVVRSTPFLSLFFLIRSFTFLLVYSFLLLLLVLFLFSYRYVHHVYIRVACCKTGERIYKPCDHFCHSRRWIQFRMDTWWWILRIKINGMKQHNSCGCLWCDNKNVMCNVITKKKSRDKIIENLLLAGDYLEFFWLKSAIVAGMEIVR